MRRADVLAENFRPGVMDRADLSWDTLSALHPRLIYASISGFGQDWPCPRHGGLDMMAQAMSGLMAGNGPEDCKRHRLPIAVTDVAVGMCNCIAVLSALAARERTGRGQQIDQSLLPAGLALRGRPCADLQHPARAARPCGVPRFDIVRHGIRHGHHAG